MLNSHSPPDTESPLRVLVPCLQAKQARDGDKVIAKFGHQVDPRSTCLKVMQNDNVIARSGHQVEPKSTSLLKGSKEQGGTQQARCFGRMVLLHGMGEDSGKECVSWNHQADSSKRARDFHHHLQGGEWRMVDGGCWMLAGWKKPTLTHHPARRGEPGKHCLLK